MVKKSFPFSLCGINIEKIHLKYEISEEFSIKELETLPKNITKIEELNILEKQPEYISFLDECKNFHKCAISYINFPSSGKYRCFWDRNDIPKDITPIGCPVKYIPHRITKTYNSEISKENYRITEAVSQKKFVETKEKNDDRISLEKNGFYESDGIFCSFNCCMAYILAPENKNNPLYKDSESLLMKIYIDLFNEENIEDIPKKIFPAPHWRTLVEYGGNLSIENFRESFNKISYNDYGKISFLSYGKLFEDKIKF